MRANSPSAMVPSVLQTTNAIGILRPKVRCIYTLRPAFCLLFEQYRIGSPKEAPEPSLSGTASAENVAAGANEGLNQC